LGYQGAIFVAAGIAGPLVGGLFVDHLSWRWAFYANLPLIAVSMVIVGTRLRIPYRRIPHAIDVAGSLLLTGTLASLVLLASQGGDEFAWASPAALALVTLAALLGVAFVMRERSAPEPFVPLRLFRNRVVRVADALNVTSGMLFFCGIFFLPQFLQEVAGASPTTSGLLLIPYMVATAATTLVSGRRVERTGRYKVWPIVGGVCMTAGVGLLATIRIDTPMALATAFAALLGAGVGFTMQPSLLALQNGADREDLGIATSSALLGRTLGGTIAVPIFAAILRSGLDAGSTPSAFASALPQVFLAAVPIGIVSVLVASRLEERPLREEAHYPVVAPAEPTA
jgi:MFS family permease